MRYAGLNGGNALKPESQLLDRALLASAAKLAKAGSTEELLNVLGSILVSASKHIRVAQLFLCQTDDQQHMQPVATLADDAPELAALLEREALAMSPILRRTIAADKPVIFRLDTEKDLGRLHEYFDTAHVVTSVAIPFAAPHSNERIVVLLYLDDNDYLNQVGLEPFVAYTCLCSVLLNHATQRQQLSDFATFDHLTGLLNRRALAEILEREHVRAERYSRRYSILFFDLDHFKRINDTHGHNIGDQALQAVARTASKVLREGDWIGRWGGEEFLCILPDACDGEAERVAQRLRLQVLEHPLTVEREPLAITLSIGVACFPQDGFDINTLLVHADAGLADAKQNGRNCVRRYAPEVAKQS